MIWLIVAFLVLLDAVAGAIKYRAACEMARQARAK